MILLYCSVALLNMLVKWQVCITDTIIIYYYLVLSWKFCEVTIKSIIDVENTWYCDDLYATMLL